MILADKIISLRKREGMTQEDLASQIGVSRQSVSKWESSMAMPDLDKVVKLSQIFGVSTDFLLNDSMGLEEVVYEQREEIEKAKVIDAPWINQYFADARNIANLISLAVPTFILSAFPVMTLNNNIGVAITLLMIALAVGLCIYSGFMAVKYDFLQKEPYDFSYGVEGIIDKTIGEFEPKHKINVIIAVTLFILSPIVYLIGENMDLSDSLLTYGFLVLVAIGAFIIVRSSITYSYYKDILKYRNPRVQEHNDKLEKASGILWVLTVGIYLAYSFKTGNWGQSWVIFIIAAFIQAAVSIFFDK